MCKFVKLLVVTIIVKIYTDTHFAYSFLLFLYVFRFWRNKVYDGYCVWRKRNN